MTPTRPRPTETPSFSLKRARQLLNSGRNTTSPFTGEEVPQEPNEAQTAALEGLTLPDTGLSTSKPGEEEDQEGEREPGAQDGEQQRADANESIDDLLKNYNTIDLLQKSIRLRERIRQSMNSMR